MASLSFSILTVPTVFRKSQRRRKSLRTQSLDGMIRIRAVEISPESRDITIEKVRNALNGHSQDTVRVQTKK